MIINLETLNHVKELVGFACELRVRINNSPHYKEADVNVEFLVRCSGDPIIFKRRFYGYLVPHMSEKVVRKILKRDAIQFRERILKKETEIF